MLLHPSPLFRFPSSHCSPLSRMLLPQTGGGGAHIPDAVSQTWPAGQSALDWQPACSVWQKLLHPSPLFRFPSSHCSPLSTLPLPQMGCSIIHPILHPSPFVVFPSSHCSLPSRSPLPQYGDEKNLPSSQPMRTLPALVTSPARQLTGELSI